MTNTSVITIETKKGKIRTFKMDADQAAAFLELLNKSSTTLGPAPENGYSLEEEYCNGFIIFKDVPVLVEGWSQSELAIQYRSEPPNTAFINVSRTSR